MFSAKRRSVFSGTLRCLNTSICIYVSQNIYGPTEKWGRIYSNLGPNLQIFHSNKFQANSGYIFRAKH